MNQEDEFYDEKLNDLKYGGGIWNMISSVLNVWIDEVVNYEQLSQEQKQGIIQSRGGLLRQQENIASVMEIVEEIQKKVSNGMNNRIIVL